LSDGKKGVNILVDLAETLQNQGKTIVSQFEKSITLALIDEAWKHHLRAMDDLKQEVQLASYEQKDPLVIYKKEAFNLFTAMIGQVNRDIASFLFKAQLPQGDGSSSEQVRNAENEKQKAFAKKIQEGRGSLEEPTLPQGEEQQVPQQAPVQRQEPVRVGPKVGRNDVCPCGSGKKFKNCHGKGMGED
jgi:preprotein translocase subunit SecA